MPPKRVTVDGPSQHFSCESCYRRKLRCSRESPCLHCLRLQVECRPVEASSKQRKQRFPEAELLSRIKRYERALLAYGADLSAIRDAGTSREGDSEQSNSQSTIQSPLKHVKGSSTIHQHSSTSKHAEAPEQGEMTHLLAILEGEKTASSRERVEQVFYSRFFQDDGSSFFFTTDSADPSLHPPPFDIFKLWQTYCDNIHPLCKILHAPTFQRKISSHGNQLHLAPAADQALFFGMYLAAILSLSPEECQSSFQVSKDMLQRQYKSSAQVWLRRAGYWKTSEFSVLQAFVLCLLTQQHVVDPRALASFTGMADRLARKMRLNQRKGENANVSLIEQEIRKRVWWEIVHLEVRTLERAGMGTLDLNGRWSVTLPDYRNDGDLEFQSKELPLQQDFQPSSEMIFTLIRSQAAQCQADLSGICNIPRSQMSEAATLTAKLNLINSTQEECQRRFLPFCTEALPQHRLALVFSRIMYSRMRFSAYLTEEASGVESKQRAVIRQYLLEECCSSLDDFTSLRLDPVMQRFLWFLYHYMPAYVYIHLLRLLQIEVTGTIVDRAWQVLERFERHHGAALPVDKVILRAWKARSSAAAANEDLEMPDFVKSLVAISGNDTILHSCPPTGVANKFTQVAVPSQDDDYISMLAEIMAGNTEYDFDWSTWLNQSMT